jgi:hypothetical protein
VATLLFEAWEDANSRGLEFSPVSERSDMLRRQIEPKAQFLYGFRAASWAEAMQGHYDRQDWGVYDPGEFVGEPYTVQDEADQAAYLARRDSPSA